MPNRGLFSIYDVTRKSYALALAYAILEWLIENINISAFNISSKPAEIVAQRTGVVAALGALVLLVGIVWRWRDKRFNFRTSRRIQTTWAFLDIAIIMSIITFIFTHSVLELRKAQAIPIDTEAASSTLSNAASLALFVVATLISMMALFGWQNLNRHIDFRVKKISQEVKNEMVGRFFSMTGHTMGELNSNGEFEATDLTINESAVESCRIGYEKLKDLSEGAHLMALNNYVYYMSLQDDPSNGPRLTSLALRLRDAGQKYRIARLILTYCQVVAKYESDPQARLLAFNLLKSALFFQIDDQEREEALYCERLFLRSDLPYKLVHSFNPPGR